MDNTNSTLVSPTSATFSVVDYFIFFAFLSISGGVGIFFSIRSKKSTREFFYGSGQMGPIPLGISTGVSFLSSAALVGQSAETYINGYSVMIASIGGPLVYFLGCCTIARVLQPLKLASLNEYFSKRFHSNILSYIANIMVILCIVEYMGTCMLGSVIAFQSVTGGSISIVGGLVIGGSVAIFYTALGGLKAVVWSDVIQFGIMLAGIVTVIAKSIYDTEGGMATIMENGFKYQRFHKIDTSLDLTVRHSLWGLLIGKSLAWGIWCAQPACVQRLCSTQSCRNSYIISGIAAILFMCFAFLPAWAGLNIFGYYSSRGCDVFAAGWISKNEILLYYVRDQLSWPGFQGLLMAALYAGSLSSLSSALSAASALLWNDVIKPSLPGEVSEVKATMISKLLVVGFGVIGMFWCYALYSTGGLILQVSNSIEASMYGSYFGILVAALLCPNVTHRGVTAGLVISFGVTLWLGIGSLLHGKSSVTKLPTTVQQCNQTLNSTISAVTEDETPVVHSGLQSFYSISYAWYALICITISIVVTSCVSACTRDTSGYTNPMLLCPVCRPGICGGHCDDDETPDLELKQNTKSFIAKEMEDEISSRM